MGDQENQKFGNLSENAKTINSDDENSTTVYCHDPVVVFCQAVMMIVLGKLDVRSLALSCMVSIDWRTLASSDQLWAPKLKELWEGKAHLPRIAKAPGLSKMEATSLSIMDGKRDRITKDDMCDHAWDFRVAADALYNQPELGTYWGPPMRRYFHMDGSITAGEGDELEWDVDELSFTILTKGEMRGHYVRIKCWWPDVGVEMTNLCPPLLSVIRNPDWSWELSDDLYCYSSIPDATDKPDGTGPYAPQL